MAGRLILLDWKSSNDLYPSIFVQLAGYTPMVEETYGQKIDGYHVVRIPKNVNTPSFHHSYWERLPKEAWESFECALKLSRNEKILNGLL